MTLGTDLLLCTSKMCCFHELTQPGKDQEGSTAKILGLFLCGGFCFWLGFLFMIMEMEVEDLTRFAAGHGAALQVRANNCTTLPCLPCCQPRSLVRAGSPSAGKLLRDDFSLFPNLPSQHFGACLMHVCSCWSQGWLQLLEKSSLADPALHTEFSARSLLFFCVCNTSCTLNKASSKFLLEQNVMTWFWEQHPSWYKKKRIWQVL